MQTVLMIDDSSDIHLLLDAHLATEALALHHALDAEEGHARARQLRPDLILLDVDMPGIDGFEACRRLKADARTAHIPIVFLSILGKVDQKVTGLDLGAIDWITKPFSGEELRARVRAALRTKRFQDLLADRCRVDGLTGVGNRSSFDLLSAELIRKTRQEDVPACLVLFDVDHFKALNDSFGHPFGDRILQSIGEILRRSCGAGQFPFRYGGDEFAILLDNCDSPDGIQFAHQIRAAVAQLQFLAKGEPLAVTASLSVACTSAFALGSESAAAWLFAADHALYRAKDHGRNRVERCLPVDFLSFINTGEPI